MMRRLTYLLLALLLVAACSKNAEWDGPIIQLTLVNDELLETKAGQDGTQEGVFAYNENLINWVDLFFYPGGDTDSPATFHIRKSELSKQTSYFAQLELTWDQVDLIFPVDKGYRKAAVVAIVNYGEEDQLMVQDENDLSGTALPDLEKLTLENDFANASHLQSRFVMSGSETLTLRGRTQSVVATGTVKLSRYACKLTVGINVSTEVNQNGEVWRPMLEGMEIYLVNGVKNATLGGEAAIDDYKYFDYSEHPLRFAYKENGTVKFYFEKENGFYVTYPTYMYPQHWEYGSETEPYVKLVLPWARQAGEGITSTQRQYYYKLILPTSLSEENAQGENGGGCFVRNNWYHLNVNVDILGVDNDDAAILVDGKCYIYDWQDKDVVIKMADIGRARYLSVEEPSYKLYNITESRFAYVSSHPVEISNLRVTRPYYGTAAAGSHPASGGTVKVMEAENDIYPKGSKYVLYDNSTVYNPADPDNSWLVDEGDGIAFKHDLVADYTNPNFDYSPYTISYTLLHADHKDDDIYRQDQTIVQYPPIYLECTPNPDIIENGKPKHWGYVWVDNDQYTRARYEADQAEAKKEPGYTDKKWEDEHIWRVVHYSSGGTDMYKINVTVLPPNSGFIIGDPREDKEVYQLMSSAQTIGVFQLDSKMAQDVIKRFVPDCFEDIISMVAIIRPGVLQSGMLGDIIDRKHGKTAIKYDHPLLEPILKPTYGIAIYQEQVMQMAQRLAGYTLGGADLLRRAISKKKHSEMIKHREIFVKGAAEREISAAKANEIFNNIEKFASYGFNKSHSAAYALITYQTAWLKTHYFAEFMAAIMSIDQDHIEKLEETIIEVQQRKVPIITPSVNRSFVRFTVQNGAIVYGLGAVKGIGMQVAADIVNEREKNGKFASFEDFCSRLANRVVYRNVLEALIRSGSFDEFKINRPTLLANLESIMLATENFRASQASGQMDLFGAADGNNKLKFRYQMQPDWDALLKARTEYSYLGGYISMHPLEFYKQELEGVATLNLIKLLQKPQAQITVAGLATHLRSIVTRNNSSIGILTIEGLPGRTEVMLTRELLTKIKTMELNQVFIFSGETAWDNFASDYRFKPKTMLSLAEFRTQRARTFQIDINESWKADDIAKLQAILSHHIGRCPVKIRYAWQKGAAATFTLGSHYHVNPQDDLITELTTNFKNIACQVLY